MGLRRTSYLGILLASFFLSSCNFGNKSDDSPAPAGRVVKPESDYCSTVSSVSNPVTVTATATFDRYVDGMFGLVSSQTGLAVPYAEVSVIDSNGAIIQCGETNASGAISIQIPKLAGSYTLKVQSRANNSLIKVYVLNNPYDNEAYSISQSFSLDGTETTKSVSLTAPSHTGSVAGAFNILYDVYLANDYLRSNTACAYCTTFTVAPLARFFWTSGSSPGEWFGDSSLAISFFSPTQQGSLAKGVYILGGLEGSTCVDTDHFDNSVVLHEYGHFLEDAFSRSDSPGGSHSANQTIDPRLAWSEGWANFFQGAVLGRDSYRDTLSNSGCGSGSASIYVEFSLENINDTDTPQASLEGTYREMSIARTLNDAFESSAQDSVHLSSDAKYANLGFAPLWKSFSSTSYGIANSSDVHRNAGLFFKYLYYWINNQDNTKLAGLNTVLTYEMQTAQQSSAESYYAKPVTAQTSGACGTFSVGGAGLSNSRFLSLSNVYMVYDFDGTDSNAVLQATNDGSTNVTTFVYSGTDFIHYSWDGSTGQYSYGGTNRISSTLGTGVSLKGLAAGKYMVVVTSTLAKSNVYVLANSDGAISNNGARLCP